MVSGSGDQTIRIWDVESGSHKVLAIGEPDWIATGITSVAISPDSRWIAAGSLDNVVRVWDVSTGALVERLRGHKDSVNSVTFSPDGGGLVSGSLDQSSKYWDITPMTTAVTTGVPVGGSTAGVSFTPEGLLVRNQGPAPVGSEDGRGERGSLCIGTFVGRQVRVSLSFFGNVMCEYQFGSSFFFLCRISSCLLQYRLMERGSYLAPTILVYSSGIQRMHSQH